MGNRLDLHAQLIELLGSNAVHFQPPTGLLLTYPCIVYQLSDVETKFADNNPYAHEKGYTLTVMDRNPESAIADKVMMMSKCLFDRYFVADNLNHFVFSLYY